jgi:serine/threonine protein kinase
MNMMALLSHCALSQVLGDGAEGIMRTISDRFGDPRRELLELLHHSSEKAWKAVEISLAGESLWTRLDAAGAKSFRQQIRNLLDNMPLPIFTRRDDFRKLCLQELREARRAGHLVSSPNPDELHRSLSAFASAQDQETVLARQRASIEEMARILERHQYRNLAWLVGHEVQPGQGLLVAAVQYFFRRGIECNEGLRDALQLSRIEKMSDDHEASFLMLESLMLTHGEKIELLLEITWEAHDAVLDIHQEQQKHGDRLDEIYEMLAQLLAQTQMQRRREVRPGDTRSIRGPHERARVLELVGRYRGLPETEKRQRPALLHSVALLQVAAGDMEGAQQDFEELAVLVGDDPKAKAQARYNAFQAALARHDYAFALEALCEAAALDPDHYAPFPFSDFVPERILGAGGFGVAIKCQHATLKRPLVLKVLWIEGLDRAVEDVFREALVLNDLDHPAIIHLRDCRFADSGRKRPYLVMDYFDSLSLTEYVRQHGPVSAAELLPIARMIAEALQSAHDQGILHRDIKPENVLVRREANGSWRVKLIDFGLAVKQETMQATLHTPVPPHEYTIAGTIDYASPEQMGRLPGIAVGPHSDVYGFGKTCYFALLGTPEPDDVERDTLDQNWRRLLSQCTARKIENRIKDFTAVLARLDEIAHPAQAPAPQPEPASASDTPKTPPGPAPKRLVPPRYIDRPTTIPPIVKPTLLSPLWMGEEKRVNETPTRRHRSAGDNLESDLTGAVPVEEELPNTETEQPQSRKKPGRGPLGGAFGSV